MPKGRVTILTKAQMTFIRRNRMKVSGSDMAAMLGVRKDVVTRYLRREGLSVPRELVYKWRLKRLQAEPPAIRKQTTTSSGIT